MRNFHRLAQGIPTGALLNAVLRRADLWNENLLRTTYPGTPHSKVDDIWLRFQAPDHPDHRPSSVVDDLESINYPAFDAFPQARGIVFDLMRMVEAERLGRVLITRLRPGDSVSPHSDGGENATYYDRYHLAIQGLPGSIMRCGDEEAQMLSGELWWFDNTREHEVFNGSADDRIHMIVDLRVKR